MAGKNIIGIPTASSIITDTSSFIGEVVYLQCTLC